MYILWDNSFDITTRILYKADGIRKLYTICNCRKFIPVNLKEESEGGVVFHFHPMAVIIKSNIHSSY